MTTSPDPKPQNGNRELYWLDTLGDDDRDRARRVIAMPGGSMAVAFVDRELRQTLGKISVDIANLARDVRSVRSAPLSKRAAAALTIFGGAFVQGAVILFEHLGRR